ncbi:MAG: aspartate--tRNA ligase [Oscillospiraceae bacterium]|nr:aspartate--tRNA ligase [Oscillospiraceae bacterium]
MAEFMTGLKRTHYCGDVQLADVGKTVTVCGWVQRQRDLGQIIFIDLRDRTGIVQLSFDDTTAPEIFKKAFAVRGEFVLAAVGEVKERSSKNKQIKTGDVEIFVTELRILSKAQTPPFEITEKLNTNEELRLKYRYLDLRRKTLTDNIIMRGEIAKIARDYFYENGFIEIETPMMVKSTPEGARDYLVPSRVHKGKFYALPQSPQIYKQLLMLSGFDRYIQLARCFRDEDLRADRQPEFTQIDMEISFTDVDEILEINEGFFNVLFKKLLGKDIEKKFERMTYRQAMEEYGSDKPDIRFGMKLQNISDIVKDCGFAVFADAVKTGGRVEAIVAKNAAATLTRKEIDKLTEFVKGIGAKGLAYVRWAEDAPNCSFAKFMQPKELEAVYSAVGAEKGDVVFIVSGEKSSVLPVLGALRLKVAKNLAIIPDEYKFLWIVDFPFFEKDEQSGQWIAMHHPFTMITEESMQYLDTDPGKVVAKAYDLTLNGVELSSGSMRITDYELQQQMFRRLNLTEEEIEAKFGFLVEAYKYGAPPHGGMGIGLDRVAMLLCQTDNLRDVTAFPKVQNASELMSDCPSAVDKESLDILGIDLLNLD